MYEATRQANSGDYKVSVKARTTTRTLVSTMFIFTIVKMMVLVWVSVQRLHKLNSDVSEDTNRDQECQF